MKDLASLLHMPDYRDKVSVIPAIAKAPLKAVPKSRKPSPSRKSDLNKNLKIRLQSQTPIDSHHKQAVSVTERNLNTSSLLPSIKEPKRNNYLPSITPHKRRDHSISTIMQPELPLQDRQAMRLAARERRLALLNKAPAFPSSSAL